MCNTNTGNATPPPPPPPHLQSHKHKRTPLRSHRLKPKSPLPLPLRTRKTRTRTRKPKFLSLRLQLTPSSRPQSDSHHSSDHMNHRHQLDLFPLHPENSVHDKDDDHHVNVAFLFDSDGGATLNGLLGSDDSTTTTHTAMSISEEDSFSPPSLSFGCDIINSTSNIDDDNASSLVRTAMRNHRDRDAIEAEERWVWVSYSEVVEKKSEVTSNSNCVTTTTDRVKEDHRCFSRRTGNTRNTKTAKKPKRTTSAMFRSLSLKLDYEGILNAWSDKGPLYVHGEGGESPQTVPDLQDDLLATSQNGANNVHTFWFNLQ